MKTAIAHKPSLVNSPVMTDVATLRANARRQIEEGAVTPGYAGNR